ncbi:MAG TPA: lytic murein transglycosylase [Aestuariivirgaceae bacterium]|nr:lytic murein transglycosylase [Aestuariivirgaceae bacterium]
MRNKAQLAAILALAAVLQPVPAGAADPAFRKSIEALWPTAKGAKISRGTFDAAFAGVSDPDPAVLKLAANQPEFTSTTSEYLAKAVTPARIATGREMLAAKADLLSAIESRYGVDRHILLAIWGIESNFGKDKGAMSVMRSLATLSYKGRRKDYARPQIVAALKILQSGVVSASNFTGSWAGAMGHTQFIPTSYLAYAVDWTGDKKRDIWNSDADALASTANYLDKSKWSSAVPWGWEVKLPAGFNNGLIGRQNTRAIGAWAKMGIAPMRGSFRSVDAKAFLMIPQGLGGPVFLVTQNFSAIRAYNDSHSYAVAVGYLADRIRGLGEIVAPWPAQNIRLSYTERVEMQKRLIGKGFPTGGTDGRFGARTYEAIIAFQKSRNLATNGIPDRALLEELRKGS